MKDGYVLLICLLLAMLVGTVSALSADGTNQPASQDASISIIHTLIIPASTVGSVQRTVTSESYSKLRNGTGTGTGNYGEVYLGSADSLNFYTNRRGVFVFPTADIPDGSTITGATVSIYRAGISTTGLGKPSYALTSGTVGSSIIITKNDFQRFGDIELASRKEQTIIGANTYTDWAFNTNGKKYINKTGDTVVFYRMSWDVDNSFSGTYVNGQESGIDYFFTSPPPIMTITYETPFTDPGRVITNPLKINERKILPFADTNLLEGSNISINATPDEFEASSFVIKSNKTVTDFTITATDLTDGRGHTLYKNATIIQTVKAWYQGSPDDVYYYGTQYIKHLKPELLLNNDRIVRVNETAETNELWIKNATFEGYIHIDNTSIGKFPTDAEVYDNVTAGGFPQPFGMSPNENKQIWITTHIPPGQTAGTYTGRVWINSSSTDPIAVNFTVRVLPFTLQPSTLEHAIYYRGILPVGTINNLDYQTKTEAQYVIELEDMKNHGILYPTNYNNYNDAEDAAKFHRTLVLRNASGLPKDHIYLAGNMIQEAYVLSSDPADLAIVASRYKALKNAATTYGFGDVYAYGYDEASETISPRMRPSLTTIINNGGKTYYATAYERAVNLANVTSLAVIYSQLGLNTTLLEVWKTANPSVKIFEYHNPQMGYENSEINRQNYGFALWISGYDGAMDYAYQHRYGQSIWNDYDTPGIDDGTSMLYWRDHVAVYPKTDGVIDTIQWEGYREGVDDSRYADTLVNLEGNDTSARAIISDSLSKGEDMAAIREKIIAQILIASPTNNEQSKIGIYRNGIWSLDSNGNFIWEVSDKSLSWGLPGDIPVIGDWNGDGKDDIGIFRQSSAVWNLDSNGNYQWDATDRILSWGLPGDIPVIGDWNGDKKDEIGIFRPGNGIWSLDSNGDYTWEVSDKSLSWGLPGDIPVVGNWNGDGKDDIGIFRPSNGIWSFDSDGDFVWEGSDKSLSWGLANDKPVIGNWNGDGKDDIGIFRPGNGMWSLDTNGNFAWEVSDKSLSWGLANDKPVIGDWNGDGKDKIGIFRPSKGIWSLDSNGNYLWEVSDKSVSWGQPYDVPVVGNWNGG